jgi:hypothetical protein
VRSERRHRLVITDTFSTGVIVHVTGRLITLVDGIRYVARFLAHDSHRADIPSPDESSLP